MDATDRSWLMQHGYNFRRDLFVNTHTIVALFVDAEQGLWAIKRRCGPSSHMAYEQEVHHRIYTHSQRLPPRFHLIGEVGSLPHRSRTNIHYLVQQYLPGQSVWETFHDMLEEVALDKLIVFTHRYIQMVQLLSEFEQETGFTHYDLHLDNIITDDQLVTFKIIDFGFSHYPGVTGWVAISNASLLIGSIPSMFDPWFDLVRLMVFFYKGLGFCPGEPVHQVLLRNRFSPWTGDNEMSNVNTDMSNATARDTNTDARDATDRDHPWLRHPVQRYAGAELLPDLRIFTQAQPWLWRRDYGGFWVGDGIATGEVLPDISQLLQIPDDDTRKLFGDMVTDRKRRNLEQRPDPNPAIILESFAKDVIALVTTIDLTQDES